MTDIEQTRMLAGPEMLGHDAFILNRHHIARKAHHARAAFTVPCIERQPCIDRFNFGLAIVCVAPSARFLLWRSRKDAELGAFRSEATTSVLQSLIRISYAVST